jgi:diguanylate cyclase (GGDEF)-like protein
VGVIGRTFTTATETVLGDGDGTQGRPGGSCVARICVPLRSGEDVIGALDVKLRREPHPGEVARVRRCAAELGERIAALGGPPAESSAQRLLRHVARLSELEDPVAIARHVLGAALDLAGLESGVLIRRGSDGTLEPACAAGPLGELLADTSRERIDRLAGCVRDATSCYTVGATGDPAPPDTPPELDALRAAGARALVAVGLTAHGELDGMLLIASRRPVRISTDDVELLELLAALAASSLRTGDLVRSLRERAATDPLTGLGHYATFHEALSGSHRRPSTAVVLCDIDGFKRLNDTFGHQHGDHVLRSVAAALSGALRRGDSLFRIGGDEFAGLLAVADGAEALDAGLRLRAAVEQAALGVTVSIGVAVPRGDDESDSALLARADRALYRVKETGRDGVALANDEPLPIAPSP